MCPDDPWSMIYRLNYSCLQFAGNYSVLSHILNANMSTVSCYCNYVRILLIFNVFILKSAHSKLFCHWMQEHHFFWSNMVKVEYFEWNKQPASHCIYTSITYPIVTIQWSCIKVNLYYRNQISVKDSTGSMSYIIKISQCKQWTRLMGQHDHQVHFLKACSQVWEVCMHTISA